MGRGKLYPQQIFDKISNGWAIYVICEAFDKKIYHISIAL